MQALSAQPAHQPAANDDITLPANDDDASQPAPNYSNQATLRQVNFRADWDPSRITWKRTVNWEAALAQSTGPEATAPWATAHLRRVWLCWVTCLGAVPTVITAVVGSAALCEVSVSS